MANKGKLILNISKHAPLLVAKETVLSLRSSLFKRPFEFGEFVFPLQTTDILYRIGLLST